jgi:hypothetical protein
MDTERTGLSVDPRQLGRETDTGLVFKPSEIEFITKHYRELYSNRQDKLAEFKKNQHFMRAIQKQDFGENFTYMPQTSVKTAKLARRKTLNYDSATTKIEERLVIAQKYNDNKMEQKKAQYLEDAKRKTPFKP